MTSTQAESNKDATISPSFRSTNSMDFESTVREIQYQPPRFVPMLRDIIEWNNLDISTTEMTPENA